MEGVAGAPTNGVLLTLVI